MGPSTNQYLLRSIIFLVLIIILVIFLYPVLISAFLSNVYINSVIVLTLLFGIAYSFYHLNQIKDNFDILNNFNIHKSPQTLKNFKGIFKNLILEISEIDGQYKFKSSRIDKILESIDINLSSIRETSRYLVGLLVFLGLLGTFWGLLKTIGSVGNVIGGLGIDDTNLAGFFDNLKSGLAAPLDGMSIAFSSSLLGLSGSLILGFMDLQLGQSQNKLSIYVEKILIENSSPDFINEGNNLSKTTLSSIQKIYDNLDSLVFSIKESSRYQKELYNSLKSLSEQLHEITKYSRDQEKKLSNFLSTQLNTESSILQLTSRLSKDGIIDKKTKLILSNIDKSMKFIINKKK
ncbi:MAG: hypothetical protein CFH19_00332 [Alphaproteobacteria bacterium MarineAlpha5_Bin9]|nr:MAG: hypothetical protein CFH19_00332 [Alphaproteobacteria bacterium MarineAlpha5_Bin9]|tara:strand:+ start:8215 stop:9255 length:1041 start_codon:yes stop_codon:yes gene_type:complete